VKLNLKKPTTLKVNLPFCGITEHTTMPGCFEHSIISFCLMILIKNIKKHEKLGYKSFALTTRPKLPTAYFYLQNLLLSESVSTPVWLIKDWSTESSSEFSIGVDATMATTKVRAKAKRMVDFILI
jgi:hypothetical protein